MLLQQSTHDEETTFESDKKFNEISSQKENLKKKLIEKYFSELPENEHTQKSMLNFVKYMIKNL